ncbi:MAG: sporulation membrane protein YtaF [Bacillota bacterium]
MLFLSVLAFAVALSLDGFGVGVSYGIRKIKIPLASLVVISLTSSAAIGISMLSGHLVARYISPEAAEIIGAVIIISVGLWVLYHAWRDRREGGGAGPLPEMELLPETEQLPEGERQVLKIRLKPLGLVIQILREPAHADLDKSGAISVFEAMLLGLALAMDALGAGFGAAMTGFEPVLTVPVVGLTKFIMVGLGDMLGRRYAANWLGDRAAAIPGWVLIGLGLLRVFRL